MSGTAPTPPKVVDAFNTLKELFADVKTTDEAVSPSILSNATEPFKLLVAALEATSEIPVHIRVKCLNVIGERGGVFETAMLRKTVTALVKVISGEDNSAPLLLGAINALVGICSTAPPNLAEFVVREGSDVLMQVHLDTNGFPLVVREGAEKAVKKLLKINFKAVVTKLLHWLSDDRADDDAIVLQTERRYALELLADLVVNPTYQASWTIENQQQVLNFMSLVFPFVTAEEFEKLARIASRFSSVKENKGAPLVESFLKMFVCNSRGYDSICILGPMLPNGTQHPEIAIKLLPNMGLMAPNVEGVQLAKAVYVASKHADAAVAEQMIPLVASLLSRIVAALLATGDKKQKLAAAAGVGGGKKKEEGGAEVTESDNEEGKEDQRKKVGQAVSTSEPAYLTQLEALLLSLVSLGTQCSKSFLQLLATDEFKTGLQGISEKLLKLKAHTVFAVKKLVLAGKADNAHASALACLDSLITVVGVLNAKRVAGVLLTPSWEYKPSLPAPKRQREETSNTPANKQNNTTGGKKDNSKSQQQGRPQQMGNNDLPEKKKRFDHHEQQNDDRQQRGGGGGRNQQQQHQHQHQQNRNGGGGGRNGGQNNNKQQQQLRSHSSNTRISSNSNRNSNRSQGENRPRWR